MCMSVFVCFPILSHPERATKTPVNAKTPKEKRPKPRKNRLPHSPLPGPTKKKLYPGLRKASTPNVGVSTNRFPGTPSPFLRSKKL